MIFPETPVRKPEGNGMKREYYYSDELKDDFASSKDKIRIETVTSSYRYSHRSIGWKLSSALASMQLSRMENLQKKKEI